MYSAKNLKMSVNHHQISYIQFGKGSKVLVLIPGLSTQRIEGKAYSMSWLYREFAKDYKVLMFDRRDDVNPGYSIRQMAEEIAQALDQLKIKSVDVIGVSQGGMIAQCLEITHPELVHKMVIAVTMSRPTKTCKQTIGNWISLAKNGDTHTLVKDSLFKSYSRQYIKHHKCMLNLLSYFSRVKDLNRFIILAQSILEFNISDQLTMIKCPTLVIGGRQDKVLGIEGTLQIIDQIHAQSYIYDNYGHALYLEAKDFNHRIRRFLNER
ncbi:alpha/beta fold hydrolase [Limosilactobacillus gastricus]|nr:alpha/beta hydrolase [Limosilactobacillus gastricus]QGF39690.1 alpha/beta fold hydrolase [Limosilactobacillus gastricus]